jgi:hypothetical protein
MCACAVEIVAHEPADESKSGLVWPHAREQIQLGAYVGFDCMNRALRGAFHVHSATAFPMLLAGHLERPTQSIACHLATD